MKAQRRLLPDAPQVPDVVRDEAITVSMGETAYWLLLDDPTVELLRQGVVTEELAERAHRAVSWKRDHERHEARERAEVA